MYQVTYADQGQIKRLFFSADSMARAIQYSNALSEMFGHSMLTVTKL